MDTKQIKTKKDYQDAIKRLEVVFEAKPNSKEGDELELLSMLIDNYEKENYPIEIPDSIEAINFRKEQLDINQS